MVITAFPECLQTGDRKVFNLVKRDVRTDRDSLIFIDNLNRIAFLQVHRTAHIMRECDSSEVVQSAYYVFVHDKSFPEDKEPGTNTEFLAFHICSYCWLFWEFSSITFRALRIRAGA